MKSFRRVFALVMLLLAAVTIAANVYLLNTGGSSFDEVKVDIKRVQRELDSGSADVSQHSFITKVTEYSPQDKEFFTRPGSYVCYEANGRIYRIDYTQDDGSGRYRVLVAVNVILGVVIIMTAAVFMYIGRKLIKPFYRLSELPYELAKGNLTVPLKEGRNRFFGRFVWGADMLRESLEKQRERELALQRDKQLLVLSLSHDIKTPLSAIKLSDQALQRGLYNDPEKLMSVYASIGDNVQQIEGYLSQLRKTASEELLALDVNMSEMYLSELMSRIKALYTERLGESGTEFEIEPFSDCIISADPDRAEEVLQNLMENAVKYGDGVSIRISVTKEEDCRLISVKNSGCTLDDDETAHIFDSFFRGSNVGSKPGSGLGLYIARQLMRKMGGDIFAVTDEDSFTVTAVFRS